MLLFIVFFAALNLYGQSEEIRNEVDFYVKKLKIDEDQNPKIVALITKKYNDLESISEMQNSNQAKFREKRIAIFRLTESSIQLTLKQDQHELWDNYKRERRIINANRIKELQAINASKADLKDAQYGITN